MTGFSLYLYDDFQLQVSEGLVISLDPKRATSLAQWAINSIANLDNSELFETNRTSNFKVLDVEINPLEVDQSNLSFQYGNYLIKIKKELDLTNRNINILNSLTNSNFNYMPKYYGSLSLKIYNKLVEFISIYEFIDNSIDGWTWLPKKLINKNDSWVNEVAILSSQLHRDLKKVEGDSSKEFIQLTDKLIKRELPDINQGLLVGIEKYPNPKSMLEIWNSLESQYFNELEIKKQKVQDNYKTQITHGDFHIGQILKNQSNYYVIDFDGSPVLNKELRNTTSPIEDDLAHLLLSFSLAARVSERINQLEYGILNDEVLKCQNLFLTNYQENIKNFNNYSPNLYLIEYLRFRQYYFEIMYGLKFLPRWLYAPILSLKEELG
ncbi:MAG: hypothetical protein EBV27_03140 [Actinobacteria bacterium]|nr:hypothetical protein [Actinomycetota bacterium]